jgi:4,5:9,10-diseco-3-hydroxy-5,9,17-trioxoandrosta-1(10),2-diene-4-oate hydrolase
MNRAKKILKGTLATLAVLYLLLIVIAYLPSATVPIDRLAAADSTFVEVNGQTIHYTKQGTGSPVILVHGFAGSIYTWRHLIPLLAQHYTVYAYDMLGFGLSDKPPDGNYEMDSQAKLLVGFMDALNLPSALLIGHSMGGVVIAFAALEAPQRVESLIMIEPGFYTKTGPEFLNHLFFPLDRIMAKQFYSRNMRKRFLTGSFYNKSLVTDEVIDAYMLPTRTPHAIDALARMMSKVGLKQYPGITEKVTRPTLIVWGERGTGDKLEIAHRVQREIASSRLAPVKECGHYVQEERPGELAEIIRDYIH